MLLYASRVKLIGVIVELLNCYPNPNGIVGTVGTKLLVISLDFHF